MTIYLANHVPKEAQVPLQPDSKPAGNVLTHVPGIVPSKGAAGKDGRVCRFGLELGEHFFEQLRKLAWSEGTCP